MDVCVRVCAHVSAAWWGQFQEKAASQGPNAPCGDECPVPMTSQADFEWGFWGGWV